MSKFISVNPYTDEVIREYPALSESEISQKLDISRRRFNDYRNVSRSDRADRLRALQQLLLKHKDELARTMTSEMGKPVMQAVAEIEKCAKVCAYYAENGERQLGDRHVQTEYQSAFIRYAPIGSLLMIMPWNFPFWQVFRVAAPNVMIGNSLLLKHASNVQGCARKIEQLFTDAGFEPGFFVNMPVEVAHIEKIINHDAVQGVTLTGSTKAGRSAAALAGSAVKKSVLELGGSNPMIVLEDADIDLAAEKAFTGRFQNTAHSCIAAKRFIVDRSVADEFAKKLISKVEKLEVQDPFDKDTFIGPMARIDLAETLKEQYDRTVQSDARILIPCVQDKAHFKPALLCGVKPGMAAFDEETFGPLACISTVTGKDQALEYARKTPYGLGASVMTSSPEKHTDIIDALPDGAVFFNDFVKSDSRLPFGGTRQSGYGRELSDEGIYEFCNAKTVVVA